MVSKKNTFRKLNKKTKKTKKTKKNKKGGSGKAPKDEPTIFDVINDYNTTEFDMIKALNRDNRDNIETSTGNTILHAIILRTLDTKEYYYDFLRNYFSIGGQLRYKANNDNMLPIHLCINNNLFKYAYMILREPTGYFDEDGHYKKYKKDVHTGRGNAFLDLPDENGDTVLHCLIKKSISIAKGESTFGDLNTLKEVQDFENAIIDDYIEYAYSIDSPNNEGETPFLLTCKYDDLYTFEIVMNLHNALLQNKYFNDCLRMYSEKLRPSSSSSSSSSNNLFNDPNNFSIEELKNEIEKHKDKLISFNHQDNLGNAPLHYSIINYDPASDSKDPSDANLFDFLLAQPQVNLQIQNVKGHTPLHIAVIHSQVSVVNSLLELEANPFLEDNEFHTPLYYAMQAVKRINKQKNNQKMNNLLPLVKEDLELDFISIIRIILSHQIGFSNFESSTLENFDQCINKEQDGSVVDIFSFKTLETDDAVLIPQEFYPDDPNNSKGHCYNKILLFIWIITKLSSGVRPTNPRVPSQIIHPRWIRHNYQNNPQINSLIDHLFQGISEEEYLDSDFELPERDISQFQELISNLSKENKDNEEDKMDTE
jgi:ankyrin repeat protein